MENIYYNREAEKQVLGLAISNPECVKQVCNLPPELFYFKEHQVILEAMKALQNEHSEITVVTLNTWLGKAQKLESAGGPACLVSLAHEFVLTAKLKTYIAILAECESRRAQRRLAKTYQEKLDAGENAEECRDWAIRNIREIKRQTETGLIDSFTATVNTLERISDAYSGKEKGETGIISGIPDLDSQLGGLSGSKYVAIGARPSVGKSIFALTWCVNAAKLGKRVLLISLEMDEVDIVERIAADMGNIELQKLILGKLDDEDWKITNITLNQISKLPMWFSLEADTIEKVRRCANELHENGGLDVIAIDYLQLMDVEANSGYSNRQEKVAAISRGIRKLSMELKIPILVLTQLNRNSVSNGFGGQRVRKREPTMSEARESGAIEQDANIFMLLHIIEKEELDDEEMRNIWQQVNDSGNRLMRVIIEKNRQGGTGKITMVFDGQHMRFRALSLIEET